jgi:C-terminal processing protease CtpA/Prc
MPSSSHGQNDNNTNFSSSTSLSSSLPRLSSRQGQQQQQQQQTSSASTKSGKDIGITVKNSEQNGVMVASVTSGSAAEVAGLRSRDLIAYVNNKPTRNLEEYKAVMNNVILFVVPSFFSSSR